MSAPARVRLDYPIVQSRLDNGLRVIASPDPGVGSVAVNLWYDVGSRHEQPHRTGFAHLFEHLMFQGSGGVASGEHFGLLQAAGASVNATTWFDRTNYFETLPAGGLDLALWLEADRMASLPAALTRENFENQREVVKEEKRQRYDNVPYGDVMELLISVTFPPDHPYGHTTIGSMADLDAAQLEDVTAFFTRHYLPNNAVISVVGDVPADTALDRVAHYFGDVPAGPVPPPPDQPGLPPISGLPRREKVAEVPSAAVYLTWRLPPVGTRAYDAADLALTVLGTGQSSRLHRTLVRRRELAEQAGASSLGLIGGNSVGFVNGLARDGVSPEQLEEELIAEVTRLGTEGPTDLEVQRAQATFERHWLHELARVDSRADELSGFATLHDDPTLVNRRIDDIAAIGAAEIAEVIAEWFTPEQRATVLYRKEEAR
ncbi:putative Zn-dependent peptidase [Friedmanniella endophytica]|uniref:Putative Zn-dependent peptidase n=1 Tax=Microlunatus kandeliicorticis TaxID=1759536 RepID=A0A7W3IUZ3_9ACTN|nr:pitrilysin family protein [Microlunatus kandeliicorticis]MBA8795610.1 putative Zn-dependent peptidase [Microlunatus kandeliicorticis]